MIKLLKILQKKQLNGSMSNKKFIDDPIKFVIFFKNFSLLPYI